VTADTPAVVLGAGINGLGVARSLARAGVPAWLVDADARRFEMRTRAAHPLAVTGMHGPSLIDELERLGTTRFAGLRPVLLLTQEESVKVVSHERERLSPLYRFRLPPKELLDALLHKHGFQRLAEQFGCPIPALIRVGAPAELPMLERLHYPVVVKPGERHDGYGRQFKKAYRVESAAEAIELVGRILPVMPDVVVQEWTEGPDSNIYFCLQYIDEQGRAMASFTGRKIRSWPPQVGGTASCAPAPEAHAELSALTTKFFRDAAVTGMAAMEYKRDAHTGAFRMVEPTVGRTDYQAEVATLNGVNLPHAAYCGALGLSFPAPRAAFKSIAWRVRSEDVQSAHAQRQRPNDGFEAMDGIADAIWRWSDPWPGLVNISRRAKQTFRTRAARILPSTEPLGSKP
jgi:predicted ATP-grasp superfamily ATP-dependent carboligase